MTDLPDPAIDAERRAMVGDGSQVLAELRRGMDLAREGVMAARRPPAGPSDLVEARADYLVAMLAYQEALSVYRLPIPPRLRDEVRLMRGLVSGARRTPVIGDRTPQRAVSDRRNRRDAPAN